MASSDLILTSRFGLLYALYDTDKLRTFYYPPEPVYAASFVGHPVLASTRERQWQFTRDDLSSVLAAARERGNQLGGAIWLLSFGFQDHVMERIRVCAGEALLTSRGLHLPGVSITRFGVGELEKLATSGGDCLREYQENLCAEGI